MDLQKIHQMELIPETILPRLLLLKDEDDDGSISSLVLVRLLKLWIERDNDRLTDKATTTMPQNNHHHPTMNHCLSVLSNLLLEKSSGDTKNIDAWVEGTKAYAILLRLSQQQETNSNNTSTTLDTSLFHLWTDEERLKEKQVNVNLLQPHHLSGLQWALDTANYCCTTTQHANNNTFTLASPIQDALRDLNLPFRILPGGCYYSLQDSSSSSIITPQQLAAQVDFRADTIRTSTNEQPQILVPERRFTAWQGDPSVGPFAYAGKSMPRTDWSPLVRTVRDHLHDLTGVYYDGCLLNLYPNGRSAMRYHIDPDQGRLWGYDTAVVSLGATRKFAWRTIPTETVPTQHHHSFYVLRGDVVHMFADCQERFQHSVKQADRKTESSPRASLVFKQTWKES